MSTSVVLFFSFLSCSMATQHLVTVFQVKGTTEKNYMSTKESTVNCQIQKQQHYKVKIVGQPVTT